VHMHPCTPIFRTLASYKNYIKFFLKLAPEGVFKAGRDIIRPEILPERR